jgi:hypothetical protein
MGSEIGAALWGTRERPLFYKETAGKPRQQYGFWLTKPKDNGDDDDALSI